MEIGTCSTTFAQTRGENEQEKKKIPEHTKPSKKGQITKNTL
jgi:hypothetical protein